MRWLNWLVLACVIPAFILAASMAGAFIYLSIKPVSLKPFFPIIEHTILEENVTLQAEDIQLSYHKRLRLTVENLAAKRGKRILARVGTAEVDFANRHLFFLQLRPKHIRITQTVAHMTREAGGISIGGLKIWQPEPKTITEKSLNAHNETTDIAAEVLDLGDIAALKSLKTAYIEDLYLLVQDKMQGVTWLLEEGNAETLRYQDSGLKMKVTAKIRQKEQPLVKAMPLTLTLEQTEVKNGEDGLLIRAGVARSDTDLLKPYLPENFKNTLKAEGTFGIETILHRGNRIDPPSFFLNLKNVALNVPQAFGHALNFQSVKAKGRYTAEADFLRIKELKVLDKAGVTTTVSATIQNVKTTPYVTAEATSNVETLAHIKHYFPTAQLKQTLEYLDGHIKDVKTANVRATYKGYPEKFKNCGAKCGLDVYADIVSGKVKFLNKTSYASAKNGTFYLGNNGIEILVQEGMYAKNTLKNVRVTIKPIFEPKGALKHVYVTGKGVGSLHLLLNDLAQEFEEINQIPDTVARHETDIDLTVPIFPGKKNAKLPDINLTLASTLKNMNMQIGEGLSLFAPTGELTLKDGKATLTTRGTLTALDMPMGATLKWEEHLLKKHAGKGDIWLTLKGDTLTKRIDMPDMVTVGQSLPIHLKLNQLGEGVYGIDATSNAARTAVATHAFGFKKDAGVPLKASVSGQIDLKPAQPNISLEMLTLTGTQVEVAGSAEIAGGKLTKVNLSPVKIGTQDAQQVVVEPNRISVLGNALDLQKLNLFDGEKEALPDDFVVGINLKRLQLNEHGSLSDVQAAFRREGGLWQTLEAKGSVNWDGLQPFALTMTPQADGNRLINATAKDAGKLLQALGLYQNMRGGTLQASLVLDENNTGGGVVQIQGPRFMDTPILARLLNLASLEALWDSQSGIKFNHMTIPITLKPNVININEAELKGNSMDMYIDGYVTLPADKAHEINVDGRLVPGIALNRTLAKIPVVGTILSGSQNGVIVADFKVKGALEEPDISVKPLSIVTPGVVKDIFRGIFGKKKDD